jgi:hypothetical protein
MQSIVVTHIVTALYRHSVFGSVIPGAILGDVQRNRLFANSATCGFININQIGHLHFA